MEIGNADVPPVVKVVNGLFKDKGLEVWHEREFTNHAPHHFEVIARNDDGAGMLVATVDFQEGPIGEVGVNGVSNEALLIMALTRLQSFQNSPYSSRDNSVAITKIEEALMWLGKRTADREARGVEGTLKV